MDPDLRSFLIQYYRGELSRIVVWRQRLDVTTNWAVILTVTLLTWTFSSRDHPHYVALIGIGALVTLCLIEARRYRTYDAWRFRTRLIEENLVAGTLKDDDKGPEDWRGMLADELRQAHWKMPFREAVARRLRRVYLWILLVLYGAWLFRVRVFARGSPLPESAAVDGLPGAAVLALVTLVVVAAVAIAYWPMSREASGNVVDDDG